MNRKHFAITFVLLMGLVLVWSFIRSSEDENFSNYRHKSPALEEAYKNDPSKDEPIATVVEASESDIPRAPAQAAREGDDKNPSLNDQEEKRDAGIAKAHEFMRMRAQNINKKRDIPSGDFANPSGESFSLVDEFMALENTPENIASYPHARELGAYLLVERAQAPGHAQKVVRNLESGGYAVFTGVVKVKTRDVLMFEYLAKKYDGEIVQEYEHIQTVFLRFDEYEQTLEALEALRAEAGVIMADLEILEHWRQNN